VLTDNTTSEYITGDKLTIKGNGNELTMCNSSYAYFINVSDELKLEDVTIKFERTSDNNLTQFIVCEKLVMKDSAINLNTSNTSNANVSTAAISVGSGGIEMDNGDIAIRDDSGKLEGIEGGESGEAYLCVTGDATLENDSCIWIVHGGDGKSLIIAGELSFNDNGINNITVNERTTSELDGAAVSCAGGELNGISKINVETARSQALAIAGDMTLNGNSSITATTDNSNAYAAALYITENAELTMNDESKLKANCVDLNASGAAVYIYSGKIDFNSGTININGGSGNAIQNGVGTAIAPADIDQYIELPDGLTHNYDGGSTYYISTSSSGSNAPSATGGEISLMGPYMYDEDIDVMMTEEEAGESFEYGDSVYYLPNDDTAPNGSLIFEEKECIEDMKLKAEFEMGGELIEDIRIVKKFVDADVEQDNNMGNYSCATEIGDDGWYYFLEIVTKKDVKTFSEGDVQGVIEFNRKANNKKSIAKIKDSEVDVDFTLFYANDFTGANKIVDDKADIIWGETYALKFDNDEEIELSFGSANGGNNEGSFTVDVSGQGKVLLSYDTDPYDAITEANEGVKMNFIRFNNACFNRTGEFVYEMEDGVAAYRIVDGKLIEIPDCYDKGEGAFVFTTRILEEYVFANAKLNMPA
ncbi:MAG: hypothetical protein J6C75_04395, partial [Oscillospiraceae bacterium]|nr:hypothetical protein [Oscillospiraceae bacterium]